MKTNLKQQFIFKQLTVNAIENSRNFVGYVALRIHLFSIIERNLHFQVRRKHFRIDELTAHQSTCLACPYGILS